MKNIILILVLVASFCSFGATNSEPISRKDFVSIGSKNSTANKGTQYERGDGTKAIMRANFGTNKFEQSFDDGQNYSAIGSGEGGGGGGVNILDNPTFDSNVNNWTASATSLFVQTTTLSEVALGDGSAKFDPTGPGEFVIADDAVMPNSVRGNPCLAEFEYMTSETSTSYVINIYHGTGTSTLVATHELKVPSSTSLWVKDAVSFVCPERMDVADINTISMSITSTGAANPLELLMDNMYLGSNKSLVQVAALGETSIVRVSGNTLGSGSTRTVRFQTAIGPQPGDAVTHTQDATLGSEFTIKKNGTYHFDLVMNGAISEYFGFTLNADPSTNVSSFLQTDSLICEASRVTDASHEEYNGCTAKLNAGDVIRVQTNNSGVMTRVNVKITHVPDRPDQTSIALLPSQVNLSHATAYWGDANCSINLGTSADSSEVYNNVGDAVCDTFAVESGSGVSPHAGGDTGVTKKLLPGTYKACFSYLHNVGATTVIQNFRIAKCSGTTACSTTTADYTGEISSRNALNLVAGETVRHCGTYDIDGYGDYSFNLQENTDTITGASTNQLRGNFGGTDDFTKIYFSIEQLKGFDNLPIIMNQVASEIPAGLKFFSCRVTAQSGTPIFETVEDCSVGVDSITDNAVGSYFVNFKQGLWSVPPVCVISNAEGGDEFCKQDSPTDIDSLDVICRISQTGATVDTVFDFICAGIK